jgi:hypothetical protein
LRRAPGHDGRTRPAGAGRRSRAAAPSSSAPPCRPSRPPNLRTARTRSAVSRELSRPATPAPRFPELIRTSLGNPIGFIMTIHRLTRMSRPCRSRYATIATRSPSTARRWRPDGAPPAGRHRPSARPRPYLPGQDRWPDQQKRPMRRGATGMEKGYTTRQARTHVRRMTRDSGQWPPNLDLLKSTEVGGYSNRA